MIKIKLIYQKLLKVKHLIALFYKTKKLYQNNNLYKLLYCEVKLIKYFSFIK